MPDQFGNYTPALTSAGLSIATYEGNGSPEGVITPTATEALYIDWLTQNRWRWRNSAWSQITMPENTIPGL